MKNQWHSQQNPQTNHIVMRIESISHGKENVSNTIQTSNLRDQYIARDIIGRVILYLIVVLTDTEVKIEVAVLTDIRPGIVKHTHPGAILPPILWVPGICHCSKHPLRMWHHYCYSAIPRTEAGDPHWRTIRVIWVLFRNVDLIVHKS